MRILSIESVKDSSKRLIANGLYRKSAGKCSIWAEQYRRIKGQPWQFTLRPWLREMHDADDFHCVGQKSAQVGYTETVLNRSFYNIDFHGKDVLYILPSQHPDAKDFSVTRFDPAIQESEHLSNLFSDVKNVGLKRAGSACLYIRGSRSRSQLKSIPVAFLVMDEVDEFSKEAIGLAEERLSGQETKQQWAISTPSIPDHGINAFFKESTQEHFFFKCPSCSRQTELVFPDSLVITADSVKDPAIYDSHLICKECKAKLPHDQKPDFLATGKWVAQEPAYRTRGFYINQLYSSTVQPWEIADKYLRSRDDIVVEQEFYNSKLGLPKIPQGSQILESDIDAARGDYLNRDNSYIRRFTTMGIDVGTWLHVIISSWEFPENSRDINTSAVNNVALINKVETFAELHDLVREYEPRNMVIDAHPEKRLALDFARQYPGRAFVCFYGNNPTSDLSERTDSITVDRTSWLDMALGRFKNGTIRVPKDVPLEFKENVRALVRTPKKNDDGSISFRYLNTRADHYAHALNYSEIALRLSQGFGSLQTLEW